MTRLITRTGQPVVRDRPRPTGAAANTSRCSAGRFSVCRICPHDAPNVVRYRKPSAVSAPVSAHARPVRATSPTTNVAAASTVTTVAEGRRPSQPTTPTGFQRHAAMRAESRQ